MRKENLNAFTVEVSDELIDDLRQRLKNARYPDEDLEVLDNKDLTLAQMQAWVDYWQNKYPMKNIQYKFNDYDLYQITIEDIPIVFNHIPTQKADAPVLLLLHGWPDTALSYHLMIDHLTNDFELIIPTLPAFGPPGPLTAMNTERAADLFQKMMTALVINTYYVHGVEFGASIARHLAVANPESVKGMHVTMLPHASPYDESQIETTDIYERKSLEASQRYQNELFGYASLQSTRPQDIAYGMSDSPLALLAWIGAQFLAWSPEKRIVTDEQIIDTVMVYWV